MQSTSNISGDPHRLMDVHSLGRMTQPCEGANVSSSCSTDDASNCKSVVVAFCKEARADDSHHVVELISLGHLTSSSQALGTGQSVAGVALHSTCIC